MNQSHSGQLTTRIGSGLYNLGNSCYMNATLQCLAYSIPFSLSLIDNKHSHKCTKKDFCTLCEIEKIINLMLFHSNKTQKPHYLFQNINEVNNLLTTGCQEDAHEFYQSILDRMEEDFDKINIKSNLIRNIFGGETMTEVMCSKCNRISSKKEPFSCISLEIGPQNNIYESFDLFTKPEMLYGSEKYFCSNCDKKVVAAKKISLSKLPNILSVHLKRFSAEYKNGSIQTNKIRNYVYFPKILDLSKNNKGKNKKNNNNNLKYCLYAVLVHSGSNLDNGHYYSLVKSFDNKWYKMDDNQIIPININFVLKEKAYILFYERIPNDDYDYDYVCDEKEKNNDDYDDDDDDDDYDDDDYDMGEQDDDNDDDEDDVDYDDNHNDIIYGSSSYSMDSE